MNYPAIITSKYAPFPGHTTLVLNAVCKTLTGRMEEVDWVQFDVDDWNLLSLMAKTEGVAPLLYDAFKRLKVPTFHVPRSNFQTLENEYYSTAAYNALLFSELDRVLAALNAADIPVIILKGAALAQTFYLDPALRPMGDLDLLVPVDKIDHAGQVVGDLGYLGETVAYWPSLERLLGHHDHLQNSKGVTLELHWSLTRTISTEKALTAMFWQDTQRLHLDFADNLPQPGFLDAHTLSPTSHLMYLSAHLFLQHGAAHGLLLWLYDLHLLLTSSREGIDWEILLTQSQQLRWSAAVATALSQLRDAFHAELPPGILEALHAHQDTRGRRLVSQKSQPNQSRIKAWWRRWRMLNWRERFGYSLGNFFPSPAFIRKRYDLNPTWLWPLYYLYRWGDMFWEGTKALFQR